MTETTTATAVHQDVTVELPQERAFALFTERFDEIKPRDHTMLEGFERTVLEPFVGGRLYDRAADGSSYTWGAVAAWEPPERFVFSWHLSPSFEVEQDPARYSEVEVRFVAEGPSRTRVELDHRHLDRHGVGWESERDAVAGANGWPLYLEAFAALAAG